MEDAALFFDKGLRGSIKNIVVCRGPFLGDLQWQLTSLPIRLGGLGLYSAKVASSYAFVALKAQYWVLQDHILRDSGICGRNDDYVFALACLRGMILSFDFSCFTNKDIALSKAQQTPASALFSEIVKDMEAHFDMTACSDSFGEHAIHCKELPVSSTETIWLGTFFLTYVGVPGSPPRKKHLVSPLVEWSGRGFTVGQAALKTASCKMTKHEKAFIENQHVFIPFAFDTFGFLAPKAVELLNRD
ncbi:hypothetical protein Tco_1172110 [Tanacetum coccineum]